MCQPFAMDHCTASKSHSPSWSVSRANTSVSTLDSPSEGGDLMGGAGEGAFRSLCGALGLHANGAAKISREITGSRFHSHPAGSKEKAERRGMRLGIAVLKIAQ